jgi:hypothetical protein
MKLQLNNRRELIQSPPQDPLAQLTQQLHRMNSLDSSFPESLARLVRIDGVVSHR